MWNEAKIIASSRQIEVKFVMTLVTLPPKKKRFLDDNTPDENMNESKELDECP